MNSMLEQFNAHLLKAGRRTEIAPELIDKWEWDARFYGDKNIKVEIAKIKRTATALEKAVNQFCNLTPAHAQSVRAAVVVMRELAVAYTGLAAWAREYNAFCAAARDHAEQAEIETFARSRWPDQVALEFERALLNELQGIDGRLAFATWCHATGRHNDCALDQISPPVDYVQTAPTTAAMVKVVKQGMERRVHLKWMGNAGLRVVCSWADYESYITYRRSVAETTASLLKQVSGRA